LLAIGLRVGVNLLEGAEGISIKDLYAAPIPKMDYHGNGWDYLKAIPNAGIGILNGLLGGTLNGTLASAESLQGGTYLRDVGNEASAIGASLRNYPSQVYEYATSTPAQQQLKDMLSPQSFEQALTFATPLLIGKANFSINVGLRGGAEVGEAGIGLNAGANAAKGGSFAEKAFLSEGFGITSEKFGSSLVKAQGTLNKPGGLFKMGWSNVAKNGGGMQMRIGIGSKTANPNQALFHMYVPKTFVPNSFANPSMQVKLSLYKLGL